MPGHVVKSTGPDPDPTEFLFISLEQKRIDQTKPYDAKKSCWVPCEKEGFVLGEIQGTKGDLVTVAIPGGETKNFKKDLVQQVNPPKFEKCEDMSNLTYLNDASVLYNLKARYVVKLIYTYSGLFCVAINPYKRYPIYTARVVKIYQGKRRNEVPPHIFAISDGAYMDMLTNHENQSMLITGESGAGKTENTKKVIAYFANVGASTKKKPEEEKKQNLEDQIVQTNPVLEAFGNAKTVRNDNSSRFGKFIRIHFGASGKLSGADIEVYLLEKARVISQQTLERSYHIFYQLMSDQVKTIKPTCLLTDNIYDYYYVSQGKVTVASIDDAEEMEFTDGKVTVASIDDKEDMEFTDNAFDILGFTPTEKEDVYKITAVVMHFGGMKFKQRGREEQAEADGTEVGETIGKLCGIEGADLYKNLTKPKIKVGNEFVTQGRNKDQVSYSVGAMSKAMFDRLFKWLVKKCNETLATGQKRVHFIGVLDIAGFEIFDFNGFEQICINFCNEKLQQFFNHHMFVLEQEEYKKEGINWVFVDFGMDLQACIELFEKFNGFEQICINFCNEKLQQFFNHHMFVLEQEEYKKEGIEWIFVDFGMDLQACIELFEKYNGFEQLCINFTNEKLQQFFNHHMFVLEQEEYKREGINWVFIDFGLDLQACIELIEKFNGFEQLCINFTNEKLQQFFNHHMFVLEQEEYKREGIDWVFIDFGLDLQACIELIEKFNGFEQLCINFTNEKLQQFFNHHMFVLEQEEYKREGINWVFIDFGLDLQACIELIEKFNSFEQLCINFTNEKLQQFFNHHMFVLEQEEYKREGIEWTFIDFGLDLQACIELIEKPLGILSILEEESMFPKATDKSFEEKLKSNHLGKSPNFIKPKPPKPGQAEAHFAIVHYAGTVAYNLTGWLEKNKDPLNDTVVDQFKKGSNELLKEIFADHPGQSGGGDAGGGKGGRGKKSGGFQTVSSGYRDQLNNLMRTLNSTSPHFIRCIVPNEHKQAELCVLPLQEQLNNLMTVLRSTAPHFIRCIIPNEVKAAGVVDAALVMHQLTCNGVLEGIRICRKGFPNRMVYPDFKHRYLILAPKLMKECDEDKKAAGICLTESKLEEEKYRLGNTKVFFRAGVLGQLEEIRDERLGKIISWLQSWIRGYAARKEFKKLQEQRVALIVVQRNLRKYLQLRTWPWYRLWQKVKPLLNVTRVEDEIRALEEKAAKAQEDYERESKLRKELETANVTLLQEKNDLMLALESTKGNMGEFLDKQAKLASQKADLEAQLNETTERLQQEEEARNQIFQGKKKLDQEIGGLKKDVEDLELAVQKSEQDKSTKDHQIRNLNDEIAHQDELINKINKEKKHLQECNQKTAEDLQAIEDKCNHLNKVKSKLEQTLDELEDSLEREKKLRAEIEKSKRKVEGDLKLTQEAVADLERNKKELEQTIQRKDKEVSSLAAKLEDEQGLVSKVQKQIKEQQSRIEELEEELEHERQARAKAEKGKSHLSRELEELGERLDEAGGATAAQIELNKKREAELAKLRRDLEECNIQQEAALASLRKKHNDAVAEMSEQIDHLNKMKARVEKDKEAFKRDSDDAKAATDGLARDKAASEKMNKQLNQHINEIQSKLDESNRTLNDFDAAKKKLAVENSDLLRQLEEAESQIGQLSKLKLSLTNQLDDTRKLADEESRERATLLGKFRNLEHDIDGLREQLEEEAEAKSDLQRQLSKANADSQMWRAKYEQEGVARAEELEAARLKLAARLDEAEQQIEQLNVKNMTLEKTKQRIQTELEDIQIEVERAQALANAAEKKMKNFDKIIAEWKMKVDDLAAELDASQKECRNYSTELFRVKAAYEENLEQLDSVRRENKNLADEIKDLMDQIGEGGRNIHEIEKQRKRLEIEKEELQAALEEAEAALEQEENKVLRAQLELSQVRQEIDRRIQEKEEEFDNTRKCHQRAIDSMQASLEAEAKGKAEALRMKKKLESDINELEIALDHSNKANADLQKHIKKLQTEMKDMQTRIEEEHRLASEYREQFGIAERRANALHGELEESRTLLEQSDRGRRQAEAELAEASEHINELAAQNNSLTVSKRKLEGELQALHADLDEMLNEAKNSEEKAKKAMVDAARLADELRAEQEHAQNQEKLRKGLEVQVKELQVRLEEVEGNALRNSKKAIAKLEGRIREVEGQLDDEARRHADAQKNLRKCERRIKELTFQSDEDKKNHERMQDLVDKLQQKIKTYKHQIEEAEEIAALNLAKFRKAQQELEEAEERADHAEQVATKAKVKGRAGSLARMSPPRV